MVAFDLERIYQSSYGQELLNDTLVEHERVLWELEHLEKEPQSNDSSDITNKLELIKAQILLFERLMIGKKIDSLVLLIDHYVEIISQPHCEIKKANSQ